MSRSDDERRRLLHLKPNLERRAQVFDLSRAFFRQRGFLEVETPVRMPVVAPEANIKPIASEGWYLSTSPELHMKRLLSAGYERIFQMGRCFRQGERGRWHNPEFTILEWYRAGAGFQDVMRDAEELMAAVASGLGLGSVISYQGRDIDISLPWPRVTVREAFRKHAGWDPAIDNDPDRFDVDLLMRVLPALPPERPAVLEGYPAAMASLARLDPRDPQAAERAEAFIAGLEIANAFSELVDPGEQERRFAEAIEEIRREQGRQAEMPRRFLEALPHMPRCGGIALGMDRLAMLFCDAASIDEVMAFTVDEA